jgi:antitoxin component of MazEF toxin-antitoxin module
MDLQTTVGIAKTGTRSLKVTIPEAMVYYLKLESGDKLEWIMSEEDGKRTALVRKAKR